MSQPELETTGVEQGIESSVDDPLRADVHPAAGRHLAVVGDAHLLGGFPVVLVVEHSYHQGIGDDDAGSIGPRGKEPQRMPGFDHQRLVRGEDFEVLLDQAILQPVLADAARFAVGDQFVRIERDIRVQVVVDHHLKSLAFEASALILVDWLAGETLRRHVPIRIDPAAGFQFLQKFRRQCCVKRFGNIPKSILQGRPGLRRGQFKTAVRRPSERRIENRRRGQLGPNPDGKNTGFFVFTHDTPSRL